MDEIKRLESDDLILRIFETGVFSAAMKHADCEWGPDPWQGVPCRLVFQASGGQRCVADLGGADDVTLTGEGDGVRLDYTGKSAHGAVSVTAWLGLKGNVLSAAVRDVHLPEGSTLVSVEYPFRCFHLRTGEDRGYLALPNGEGCLVPTGPVKLGTTAFWCWEDMAHSARSHVVEHNPAMPFYGAQKDGAGYTAILETTDDFTFQYLINSDFQQAFDAEGRQSPYDQIACAWPTWLSQKGKLGYERRMRFEFAENLDYVGMAKAYRKEAIARGHLVTLREKAKERPQIDRLAGAPYLAYYAGYPHVPPGYPGFEHTYKQLGDVVDDLAGAMGLKRAFVHFWGAYSVQPPGCLPFDTAPGPVDDLAEVVSQCKKAGFLFTLYNDISAQLEETDLWFPELMWKTANGKVREGRRWSRTCSSQYVDLLARHMPEVVETLGVEAAYVDCINSGRMEECYDPEHPLTRTEDREARTAFYQYVHSLGLIFGGEHAGWWNAAELEYSNGVGACSNTNPLLRQFPVPLYHLVFHDALIPFCHAGDDYTVTEGTAFVDKVLRDLLRGIPPMYFLNLWDHAKWRQKILDSYAVMSDPVAAVLYDEMLSHERVTDDQMVQRTRFASGVEITVNFDEIEREGLPGKGYRVTGLDDGPRQGAFVGRWTTIIGKT
ncbi:MAG: hypothetical protein GXP25_03450 [Planctomycetes bacterium]|nr:hypothetical protein [Planctomycetota bacterium]